MERVDDVRGIAPEWLEWFGDGRSMVAGALGWLWVRSPWVIPIPGFRTRAQVEQNAAAREVGPLTAEQMSRIQATLRDAGGSDFEPMPGRPMKGFFCLPARLVEDDEALSAWVERARAHAASLPPRKPRQERSGQ